MATPPESAVFPHITGFAERGLRHGSLFWLMQGGGWLAFGVVMFGWALAYWPAPIALLNKLLLVALGIATSLGFRALYRRVRVRAWSARRVGIVILGASFSVAPIWYEGHIAAFRASCAVIVRSSPASSIAAGCARKIVLPWLIPTETWLLYGFVLVTWSLLYFVVGGLSELHGARERAARADALALAARLKALQVQLEPHFLFNALNAISTLVVTGRNDRAAAMISEVSDFLRSTLSTLDTPVVSLGVELQFVRQYLKIQEYRFADRLRTEFDIEAAVLPALVPTLLLQPIVENAVRHGIWPKIEGGCIWVRAARRGGMLSVAVEDNGVGIGADWTTSRGVGLANVAKRLEELYGDKGQLDVGASARGGTVVRIELPYPAEGPAGAPTEPVLRETSRCAS
jgi:two-component system, LytTR family, sensor kinase